MSGVATTRNKSIFNEKSWSKQNLDQIQMITKTKAKAQFAGTNICNSKLLMPWLIQISILYAYKQEITIPQCLEVVQQEMTVFVTNSNQLVSLVTHEIQTT